MFCTCNPKEMEHNGLLKFHICGVLFLFFAWLYVDPLADVDPSSKPFWSLIKFYNCRLGNNVLQRTNTRTHNNSETCERTWIPK